MTAGGYNSVVIDIKDYSGYILYPSLLAEVTSIDGAAGKFDPAEVVSDFHAAGIYLIARQTVFQDPVLARARPDLALKTVNGNIWYDKSGLAWLDPSRPEVWDYNAAIAKEADGLGFDEINFDYVRYPSDGNIGILNRHVPEGKTKSQVLGDFFAFMSDQLSPEIPISADTFGLVMDHADDDYDLGIGQQLTEIVEHVDYVSPMMYPSHYPLSYLNLGNPAAYPGAVLEYGIRVGSPAFTDARAKLRPWLQAFHLGAYYDQAKVAAQIQAVENATSTQGWLLWNARNVYPDYLFEIPFGR